MLLPFLLRRLAGLLFIALGTCASMFFLAQVIPSDPARVALGAEATEEMLAQYRQQRGLDRPIVAQFGLYLAQVARGDLGQSIVSGRPVVDDLRVHVPATLELMLFSLLVTVPLGVTLGVLAALHRRRWVDHVVRLVSVLGMSMPVFWFGLMLQLLFYRLLGWLPAGGRLANQLAFTDHSTGFLTLDAILAGRWDVLASASAHLVLPAIALSTVNLAAISRVTRVSVLGSMRQDYVRTARSKGITQRAVLLKHVLRNALVPILTETGLRIGVMFGGAVLTETIFAWPGLGRYAYFAVRNVDFPVIIGFTLWATLAFALVNLLVDLLYAAVDPRISVGDAGGSA